jgi:hypothetical protein
MPDSTSQEPPSGRTDNDRAIFASLREIHEAAHTWQSELTVILDKPPAAPEGMQSAIAEQLKRKPQIEAVVRGGLKSIRDVFSQDVKEREWGSGMLTRLDLTWQDLENHWPPDPQKPDLALGILRSVRDELDEIIFICLENVLTPDINDRLPNLEVGQPLDLEFVYGKDFPLDPERRKRLVLEVAQEQAIIRNGVFDPESGLIYRIAPTEKERRKSLWRLVLLILLGGLLALGACFLTPLLPAWPIQRARWSGLLSNYVSLFLGAGFHTAIDALKQKRAQTKASFAAMDNWLVWLHIREKPLIYAILWADLGFILLTAMVHDMDWRGAFVAGYSIDSVTDLFLSRFQALVGKAAEQLKPPAIA